MSLFSEFSSLMPYIQSVRRLKEYLVFDISFPREWKLPKKFIQEDKVAEVDANSANERFFHFVSQWDEENVNLTQKNILGIVKYNIEREEKEKLFQEKIEELKTIFDKSNLRNLKTLKFDIKTPKIELTDGEDIKIPKLVGDGEN